MKNILEESKALQLQFEKRRGLLPTIVQDIESKEILMLGYSSQESFEETINTGLATFWSTSREELWTKGKTSGDFLVIKEIRVDCDQDAIVFLVKKKGEGACHTKNKVGEARSSCFYRIYEQKEEELRFIKNMK